MGVAERPILIVPSVLPADFARLGDEVAALQAAGADRIQWDVIDMVLVMTVNPGFGGQDYIATMEPKIAEVRAMIDARNLDVDVEVDGGISPATVAGAARAGANALVTGSALFRDPDGLGHAV